MWWFKQVNKTNPKNKYWKKKIELFTCYASCTLPSYEGFDVILLKIEKILIMEDLHKSHQILK